jgi:5-methylcytosine-specific restriction protein B
MESEELAAFLASPQSPRLEQLDAKGIAFGHEFVEDAADRTLEVPVSVKADFETEMLLIFNLLRLHNAEFGYRTGYEAARFISFYKLLGGYSDDSNDWFKSAIDAVIVQKILPKLHGSRSKLEGLLWALAWVCGAERGDREEKDFGTQLDEVSTAQDEAKYSPEVVWGLLREKNPADPSRAARYPLSFDKVMRMWRKLSRDQFVSFAEA